MPFTILDRIVAIVVRLKDFVFTVALALAVLALLVIGYRYVVAPGAGRQTHSLIAIVISGIVLVLLASQLPGLLRQLLNRQV